MALINHRAREIHFKIVYVGPGLGGKTTNLQMLHDRLPPERRGRLVSISTDHERTLFFDFLAVDLGQVNGFHTRFHLYTVPGQVYYRLSRRAVLQGLDGLVFVADSHPAREQANRDSQADALAHLSAIGLDPAQIARLPWVFQWNKRDVVSAMPIERLRAALNPAGAPEFESVAREGRGVSETLRAACKAVLSRLTTDLGAVERPGAMAASSPGAGARPKPGVLPVARPERIVTAPRAPLRNPARA
jgi:signal recognition particle receptor subunit beta